MDKLISFDTGSTVSTNSDSQDDCSSIDLEEFRSMLSKAENEDFNEKVLENLSADAKDNYQALIDKYRKYNKKVNNEQLQTILKNKEVQRELLIIFQVQRDIELETTSKDLFVALGTSLTGTPQQSTKDKADWREYMTGQSTFSTCDDESKLRESSAETFVIIRNYEADPTNPERIVKMETILGTIKDSNQQISTIAAKQSELLADAAKADRENLASYNTSAQNIDLINQRQINITERNRLVGEAILNQKQPTIDFLEKQRNAETDPIRRQEFDEAIAKIQATDDPEEVLRNFREVLEAQGKSSQEIENILNGIADDQADNGRIDHQKNLNLIREGWIVSQGQIIEYLDDEALNGFMGKDRTDLITDNSQYLRERELVSADTLRRFDRNDPNYTGPESTTNKQVNTARKELEEKLAAFLDPEAQKQSSLENGNSSLIISPETARNIAAIFGLDPNRDQLAILQIHNNDTEAIKDNNALSQEQITRIVNTLEGENRLSANSGTPDFFGTSIV